LSFFFGDEFGALAAFGVDAVAAVLLAGLFAARHHCRPIRVLLTAILGQALLFDSLWLVLYAVIGWIATASFVHWYEEPTLVRTYGEQYEEYRRNVPAWTPRLTPWNRAPQNGGGS